MVVTTAEFSQNNHPYTDEPDGWFPAILPAPDDFNRLIPNSLIKLIVT
jgi:hypothetical protein